MKTYFTCVTYSGSTCMCGALRNVNNECGHKHRTEKAALKCLEQLQNWSSDGRSCSATWYYGRVVERETDHDSELIYSRADYARIPASDACTCW